MSFNLDNVSATPPKLGQEPKKKFNLDNVSATAPKPAAVQNISNKSATNVEQAKNVNIDSYVKDKATATNVNESKGTDITAFNVEGNRDDYDKILEKKVELNSNVQTFTSDYGHAITSQNDHEQMNNIDNIMNAVPDHLVDDFQSLDDQLRRINSDLAQLSKIGDMSQIPGGLSADLVQAMTAQIQQDGRRSEDSIDEEYLALSNEWTEVSKKIEEQKTFVGDQNKMAQELGFDQSMLPEQIEYVRNFNNEVKAVMSLDARADQQLLTGGIADIRVPVSGTEQKKTAMDLVDSIQSFDADNPFTDVDYNTLDTVGKQLLAFAGRKDLSPEEFKEFKILRDQFTTLNAKRKSIAAGTADLRNQLDIITRRPVLETNLGCI